MCPSECSKLQTCEHTICTSIVPPPLFSPRAWGERWSQALCWGDDVWIVESVRSTADASTIRQFKASSVTEGSGMIKQLLTANSAVPFHPGQGSHLRAEHNRALCNCQSSLWLSSAGCILSCQRTQRECALSTNPNSVEVFCCFCYFGKRMNESLHFKTLRVFTYKYYICSWACANFKVAISFYCF